MPISGTKLKKREITLHGMHGKFVVPGGGKVIRFFSTAANSRVAGSGPSDLLKELKPMRERVTADELKDLNSLLQRDLDDQRVANALVPYLLGVKDQLAFFPAVLGVLIPKDFIKANPDIDNKYPKGKERTEDIEGERLSIHQYGSNWKLTKFEVNGTSSSLGELSIDPEQTSIIVIDGQHRANAFRYVAGHFLGGDKSNDIYGAFYQRQSSQIPEAGKYESDLPVTLIWFENDDDLIEPTMISRRLFVDVNNSARTVSTSRTILLNDEDTIALITRFFYTSVAQSGFSTDKFSLLYSGFDVNSDLTTGSKNPFSLTTPQILYSALDKFLLDTEHYNDPSRYAVSRSTGSINKHYFLTLFGYEEYEAKTSVRYADDNDNKQILALNSLDYVESLEFKYRILLESVLLHLYNEFCVFKAHFVATQEVSKWVPNQGDMTIRAWQKVFCGGEGLYHTFSSAATSNDPNKRTERVQNYYKSIKGIEDKLHEEREKLFSLVKSKTIRDSYITLNTKAFQIGLLNAFFSYDKYVSGNQSKNKQSSNTEEVGKRLKKNIKKFVEKLNMFTCENWFCILTELKPKVIPGGLTPRQWPAFHKIILRSIQGDDFEMYSEKNFDDSPDGKTFWYFFKQDLNHYISSPDEEREEDIVSIEQIPVIQLSTWAERALERCNDILKRCDITPIADDSFPIDEMARKMIIDNKVFK